MIAWADRAVYAGLVALVAPMTVSGAGAQSAEAYGTGELPPLLPRAEEIALARSAAPPEVSDAATVLVLERGGYVVAEEGTNGVTCLVDRTWPESLEPHCFDAEGSRTILPIQLRIAELRERGESRETIDRDIADGLRTGRLPLPKRPVMSYMLSSGQVLYNDRGERVGKWRPHLMIYVPYITSAELGLSGSPSTRAPFVVDEGKPTANIVVVVSEFIDPEPVR